MAEIKQVAVIKGHEGGVHDIQFDVSNDWFATASADTTIKVWSLPEPKLLLTLTGHKLPVRTLSISQTLAYMFSGGEDKSLFCWDLETNKVVRNYHGHLSGVYTSALHPSIPYLLASGSRDSTIRVWDVRTRIPIYVLPHDGTVNTIKFQEDEPQLISGSQDKTVKFWDLKTGKPTQTLTNLTRSVRCLQISDSEYSFICGSRGIHQFSCAGDYLGKFGKDEILNTLSLQRGVVHAGYDTGLLASYNYETGDVINETEYSSSILSSSLNNARSTLITGHSDSLIRVHHV